MVRRVLAQALVGLLLIGSSPVPSPDTTETRPAGPFVPASAVARTSAPALPPSPRLAAPAAAPVLQSPTPLPEPSSNPGVRVLRAAEKGLLKAPASLVPSGPSPAALSTTEGPILPGVQKGAQAKSAAGEVQEVRPPTAPQAIVAHAPDEYTEVAVRAEEKASPKPARLAVRPAVLRFALTDAGAVLPAAQSVEVTSDRKEGVRFELAGQPDWLAVEKGRGDRAGLVATAVQVAVDGRKIAGPLSGVLEVRNLDEPADVQRIAVEVERAELGHPLRSRDAAGRLQRLVRPDGGMLDYDYDAQGRLVRVRRSDGSAVTWSYDDQGRRIAMTDGRGTTGYRYDEQGRLDAVYTPGFGPVRYGYDERNRLTTLTLPGGRVIAYEYDGADHLLAVRSDLGVTHYAYDAATGKLAERVLPNGIATRYGYDAAGRLVEVSHRGAAGGPLLSYSWRLDDQGRPVSVTRESPAGRETTDLAYDDEGRVAAVRYPDGRTATYEYDAAGWRSRETETRGAATTVTDYAYDPLGRLVRAGDEVFTYDSAGDLVRRSSPSRTVEYRWDLEGRLIGFRDGRHEVSYELDGDGRRVAATYDGRRTSLLQDASGWIGGVLAEADAEGEILRSHVYGFEPIAIEGKAGEGSFYLYEHPLRAAAGLASPAGELAETFAGDPFGAPLAQPDANLPPYLFAGGEYEPRTGLIHLDHGEYDPGLGAYLASGFEQDHDGAPSGGPGAWADLAPAGAFSEALAKALRRDRPLPADRRDEPTAGRTSGQDPPTKATRSLQATIFQSNELPPSANRAEKRDNVLPSPYRLSPDAGAVYRRGTLAVTKTLAAPRLKLHPEYLPFAKTATGLLPASQTLEIASSDGQPLSFTVAESIPWLSVSAAGGTTPATLTVTVDPSGLTEQGSPYVGDLVLTNASDATDVRKVRARLTVRSTGASVTLRSFDANGNLRRVIKPDGGVIDYEVDPLGRVTRVRYPGQPAVTYAYDGNGNRVSMTDQRGTTVYQYDRQNRLTGVFTPLGSNFIAVTYGYDNAGRLTRLATPDGRTVLYDYDADGRMTRVTDGADVTTYAYDSVTGLLKTQTLPNGITTTYTYDVDGRLTDVVHKTSANVLVMGFHYTLSALGQRTSVTKQTPSGSELTSYTYDALGRLASVTYPDGKSVSYTYDALGNRLSTTTVQGGTTTVVNYTYDKDNRLLKAGNEVFQYDANGNMIRRSSPAGTTNYSFDARNLLTRVETGGRVVSFEYDGDGNRIAKDIDGQRTNFINDNHGNLPQLLVEASANWQVLQSYSYGLQRIGRHAATQEGFYLTSAKDIVALIATDGSLLSAFDFEAFGSPLFTTSGSGFLFDTETYDSETCLIYLRARYYDPRLGRFISRDPSPSTSYDPASVNSFAFAQNDPINRIDPSGRIPLDTLVDLGFIALDVSLLARDPKNWVNWAALGLDVGSALVPYFAGGGQMFRASELARLTSFEKGELAARTLESQLQKQGYEIIGRELTFESSVSAARSRADLVISHPDLGLGLAELKWGDTALTRGQSGIMESVERGESLIPRGAKFDNLNVAGLTRNGQAQFDFYQVERFYPQVQAPRVSGLGFPLHVKDYMDSSAGTGSKTTLHGYVSNYSWPDVGGVSLNKTADLLLSLQDITGATFDEATGQIVLLGKDNIALPPLDMNHVAVAAQSVYGGQDPGVSIDLPIVNNTMPVRYEGQTSNTVFGSIMFEADRVLKILGLGKDNVTGQPVTSSVPGYKNMLQRRLDAGCGSLPTTTRMWFQPKEVRLVPSTDGKSMVFDAVSMELLYESKSGSQVVSDPVAAAFASHFTQNYAAFANEWPILKKLEQLGKIVAIIKWIKDNKIPIDLSFLDNFPIQFFSTVTTTPAVSVQGSKQSGSTTCTITLQGGVTYQVPNQYLPADPSAGAALNEALAQRPSEGTFRWTYTPTATSSANLKATSGPATAVAESLTRSRRDGNVRFQEVDLTDPLPGGGSLVLLRTYNSFLDKTGPLGPGWSVLPAELRFPVKKEHFTFGTANLTLDLFARIWLAERASGREDAYDLLGIDSSNLPIYRRADAMHILRQQSDGTFRLTREDGSTATFRADGKPLSLADPNGNAVTFNYSAQLPDRLLSLAAADGRTITFSYNAQGRISQASGPGGRQAGYGYDAQGRLTTLTDFAGRSRTYGYDATGRLASATDAEGRSIFSAGYDDYDRTPSRRMGAAAQYGMGFDLETGQSTVVDPFGRTSRQTFERRQLAAPSGIRNEVYRPKESVDVLGNRATMTWADDAFGPRSVTDAEGAASQLAWDNRGHLTTIQDPLGKQTERFFDWRDRLVAVRDPEGLATAFGYDDKNNPTTVFPDVSLTLDANGNLTSFAYDPAKVSTLTYDASGNLAAATNPLGQQAQILSNTKGQPTRVTSPAGVVTTLGYDTRSRMTSAQTGGRQVTYSYDAADQVTSVTTAAGTTSFTRDVHGRVTRVTDALTRATLFSYDTDGNLTRVEDALAGVATYAYDVLGHLLSANLPNGTSNAWEYDELGRPVAALTGLGPAAPRLALATTSLDFGTVAVGSSRQLALDLYNQGTAPLTISGITVSAPFSVAFSGPATIAPTGTLRVTVTFTPTDQLPASANLSITSDDPQTSVQLVALTGSGARKVAGLQAAPAQDGIQLTWSSFAPGSQAFGHFNVYRSLAPIPGDVTGLAPLDSSLTSASATSFLDKLATPGTSYYYAVTPVYANGDENKSVDPAGPVAYFTTFGPLAADAGLATNAQSENRPAIAYNSTANEYLVVYERQISASDTDVFGQRISVAGALVGSAFAIANTAGRFERRPRLAYNANSNNYLVVWEFDASGAGTNFDLRVRTVSATGSLGAVVTVANSTSQDLSPEIAFGSTSGEYLVVYETDGDADGKIDVGVRRLSAAGAFLDGEFLSLQSNSVNVSATSPHIAYNGAQNEFLLAFESDVANNGSNLEVWGTRVKPDLNLVDGSVLVLASGSGHDRNPFLTYDSGHNEYLLVWEKDSVGDGVNLDVDATKLNGSGGRSGIIIVLGGQSISERNPRAVYNRTLDDFVAIWETGGTTPKIQARRAHFTFSSFSVKAAVDVSAGTASRVRPDIGTSTVSNTFLATWEEDAGAGNFDVRSRLLGTFAPVLQVSPSSLSFSGATTHQTLTITNGNPAGGPLQWAATPDRTWLTTTPGSGSTTSSVAVDVAVNKTGLAPGTYTGTIHVTSNNGSADVPVTLVVSNTPPATPSAPRPADNATDQTSVSGGLDITLAWQGSDADGDALTWDLYLSTDSAKVTALDPAVRIRQGLTTPTAQPAGLAFLTSYFWRVVAFDSRGASTAGPVWKLTTAAIPPPALHAVTPDPTRETRPALTWQAVTGATSYHLQVANNPGFSPRIVDTTGLAATSFTPASPLPEGTIYWRVRSLDGAGQAGAFAVPDSFVIDTTAPGVPTLTPVTPDPTNNRRPALSWNAVTGASSYRVQVAATSGFTAPLADATVSTLSFQPAADLPEGHLFWRAASVDEAGNQSAFSAADDFTLDATPPPAVTGLTAHRNGAGVDLAWAPLAGPPADFARFRIYRAQASFTNVTDIPLLNESLTSASAVSFRDTTATSGVAYWYAITAVDAAGNENREVAVANVLANEPPTVPVLGAPAVGAQVLPSGAMSVSLSWSASDPEGDPLRYEVYLSTDQTRVAGTPDITARIAENLATPAFDAPNLAYQTTYFWRVVALDLATDGSVRAATFGPLWSFAIPPIPAPVLTAVTPNPTPQPRPAFAWQSVPGAVGYRTEIANDAAFTSVLAASTVAQPSFTPGFDLPEGMLFWHVASVDATGHQGGYSSASSFTADRTPPPAVVGLRADWAATGTRLDWNAFPASVTDVALFHVFRSNAPITDTTGLTPLTTLSDPLATTFADTTAAHGVIHHYAVTAVDRAGNEIHAVTSVATPPPGGDFYTVIPCRLFDTRDPVGPFGGPALAAAQPRSFALANRCGIPPTARAIAVNLTAVSATAPGFIKAYAGGIPAPSTSAISFAAGTTRANNGILSLQQDGTGTAVLEAVLPAGGTVHALLDVVGYFE